MEEQKKENPADTDNMQNQENNPLNEVTDKLPASEKHAKGRTTDKEQPRTPQGDKDTYSSSTIPIIYLDDEGQIGYGR